MKKSDEEVFDILSEGVEKVARESWLAPEEILNEEWREAWRKVIDAFEDFSEACLQMSDAIYKWAEEHGS